MDIVNSIDDTELVDEYFDTEDRLYKAINATETAYYALEDAQAVYDEANAELTAYDERPIHPAVLYNRCTACNEPLVLDDFGICERPTDQPPRFEIGVCHPEKMGCEECFDKENCAMCQLKTGMNLVLVDIETRNGTYSHCLPKNETGVNCPRELEFFDDITTGS